MNGIEKAFTFDDIVLVPWYTEMERGDTDIKSKFFDFDMNIPIISSPMDTVTGERMQIVIREEGGLGIHHRYCKDEILFSVANSNRGGIAVSPSMGIKFIESLLEFNKSPLCVMDVAHGDSKKNLEFCGEMVKLGAKVVSGNIVTPEAADDYLHYGVKYMRVGIGSGSVCSTRVVTGVGVPQLYALYSIKERYKDDVILISDGGHRTTGDIVKALACGASFVMLGGMLAGTFEALGDGEYRGMASAEALATRKKEFFVEGIKKKVEPKGSVRNILRDIKSAIETACYYLGAENLKDLQNSRILLVTENGYKEGLPKYD